MSEQSQYRRIARELRTGRPQIASRLALSFILGCACAALAMLGAWSYTMLFPEKVSFPTSSQTVAVITARISTTTAPAVVTAAPPVRWYRVRDETIAAAFVFMGFIWLLLLWRLWRPIERGRSAIGTILFTLAMANVVFTAAVICEVSAIRRRFGDEMIMGVALIFAIIATLAAWVQLYQRSSWKVSGAFQAGVWTRIALSGGLVGGTVGGCILLDRLVRIEEECLIAAAICAAVGVLILIWLPVIFAGESRTVRGETGHVDVRCPVCGYSLIGLRELRCPECGEQFVLDDLLARQAFLTAGEPVESGDRAKL